MPSPAHPLHSLPFPLPTQEPVEPGRLNRSAIRLPSRLGLSEPQPGPSSPFSSLSSHQADSRHARSQHAATGVPSTFLTITLLDHRAACKRTSRPDAGCWVLGLLLLAARPHGTAITPLHSPEIVGQIFRDLSAIRCLSAPPNLVRSGSAAPASTSRLLQPASSCFTPCLPVLPSPKVPRYS